MCVKHKVYAYCSLNISHKICNLSPLLDKYIDKVNTCIWLNSSILYKDYFYINKMEEGCDYYFKIILLGCQAVGKTAIVQRFCYDCYEEESLKTTLGFDFLTKILHYKGKKVQLQIWDTAGQERFRSVTKMYYQDVNGVVLVYDVSNKKSIEKLQFWLDDLEMNGTKTERRILVGNKLDIVKGREVPPYEGKKLAASQGIDWIECSAKSGQYVNEVFEILIGKMIVQFHENEENGAGTDSGNVFPHMGPKKSKKSQAKLNNTNSKAHEDKGGCCG